MIFLTECSRKHTSINLTDSPHYYYGKLFQITYFNLFLKGYFTIFVYIHHQRITMQHAGKSLLVSQKVLDDKDYDLVFNQKKYIKYKKIWNTFKLPSLAGRKSACASYQSCNVVYVCNNMEIRGLGCAIFQFISATNF